MFSYKKYELVKALHDVPNAYKPDPKNNGFDCWDNNVGECQSWFFDICKYEWGQKLPCFGCTKHL